MDWTAGYVAEIDYTYGYYGELNPLRSNLALLFGGYAPPAVFGTACELGFGQGLSVNMHAAGSQTQWYGNDFNPAQASFAAELAATSGASAQLTDEAFSEFCNRSDLPGFDFIGLHGIWSWISDQNRHVLVDFIRRKLNVGGVLYVSYNTQPGWAQAMPMRHLLTQHAQTVGSSGEGVISRIEKSLAFADRLFQMNPGYVRANSQIVERFNRLKGLNRNYLAHEYFNQDWHPMHFATMATWLADAKVSFAGSAHYPDMINGINFTNEQLELVNETRDPVFRETVRDFVVNQQFRRDYWIKGARKLSPLEQSERIRAQRVLLMTHPTKVEMKITGAIGEANLQEQVYAPILEVLADQKVMDVGTLAQKLKGKGVVYSQLIQAILVLVGKGDVVLVNDDKTISKARAQTDRLNQKLMSMARASGEIGYLVSPVTGGGIGVPRFQQLFLLAKSKGLKTPEEWADFVWSVISAQGQRIAKEGKAIESEAENRAELLSQANEFSLRHPVIMRTLGIAN
jgi:SAM-dependent methyltransferase